MHYSQTFGYSDKLKLKTDSFKELVEKIKDLVEMYKADEEASARSMSGDYDSASYDV